MSLIALGVTGGIGAYKAVEIARGLQKQGHEVTAVMTRSARRFVAPLTFEAITRRPVISDQWQPGANADIEHISLASGIALLLVAPATANTLARFANGMADDFLSSLYLATTAPVVVAPAMNTNMFAHPAVEENLRRLRARGVHIVEPGAGFLACGWIGKGRLAEPDDVVAFVQQVLQPRSTGLAGRRVLVTAGPTYEDIDPVRYIGNRASGCMGVALAAEAGARGAVVTLVTGPTGLDLPPGVDVVRVRSAGEMHAAVMERASDQDAVIMAAAVADYTLDPAARKIAKSDGPLVLTLSRTRDILADVGALPSRAAGRPVLVGFAAETHDVVAHAREKLARKRADLIVANDVSRADAGFEVDTNAVTLVTADGADDVPLNRRRLSPPASWTAWKRWSSPSPSRRLRRRHVQRDSRPPEVFRRHGRGRRQPRRRLAPPGGGACGCRAAWRRGRRARGCRSAAAPLPPDEALAALRADIGPDCRRCKLCDMLGRRQVVFGVGHPRARLMFVGEAPGEDEDKQGEPFVGRAGQLLTKIIEAISLTREQVYIANVIKCRPPGNRNPEPDEVATCEPFLFTQIETIRPRVIVALGKFAAQSLLRSSEPITRMRGREFDYRGATLIPTFHPAYLLRNPSAKREVWEDMKKVRGLLIADGKAQA
ncbi:MAG: bifunctional phosphopantothenoylcysteine decarboxylase/phosphopantothenate--cysteine ligase CoaBC [Vicinamibacterales bacterium]